MRPEVTSALRSRRETGVAPVNLGLPPPLRCKKDSVPPRGAARENPFGTDRSLRTRYSSAVCPPTSNLTYCQRNSMYVSRQASRKWMKLMMPLRNRQVRLASETQSGALTWVCGTAQDGGPSRPAAHPARRGRVSWV